MNSLKNLYHNSIKDLKHLHLKQLPVHVRSWVKTQIENLDFKDITLWIKFLAYALPFSFFLYVLYINYLPFGFEKTYTIDVGGPNDTTPSEFYLEPSPDLSERKVDENGNTYRELNGIAYATFKPNVVLKNATVTVSVEGDGVSIIPPVINFNPDDYQWDYNWDFTKGIPEDLKGNAFMFDGAAYFNGVDSRLELPDSQDKFEDGPLTVYIEWTPRGVPENGQQIIGHFNWELWQNQNDISFQIGRMDSATGSIHKIIYKFDEEFYNQKHSAIAVYYPGVNGYTLLYVDNNLVDLIPIDNSNIWREYGDQNLSFGWTPHNYKRNPKLNGFIHKTTINIGDRLVPQAAHFNMMTKEIWQHFIYSDKPSKLENLTAHARN